MSLTTNYYAILSLPLPSSSSAPPSAMTLRRAYKLALLAAHPDKQTGQPRRSHTIDQVKQAYAVLSDDGARREYDSWLTLHPPQLVAAPNMVGVSSVVGGEEGVEKGFFHVDEFVLGLEVLDLSDFDVLDPGFPFSNHDGEGEGKGEVGRGQRGQEEQMEWTRACRCGDEKGFRILEEELVEAEGRGEEEVLGGKMR
ncbi:Diphthamide biosynthesis protein 4 [Pleosporales sp. CAS-2024a]